MKQKTTKQLQAELDELLLWFTSDDLDVDAAIEKYKQGQQIISELELRLKKAELTISKLSH